MNTGAGSGVWEEFPANSASRVLTKLGFVIIMVLWGKVGRSGKLAPERYKTVLVSKERPAEERLLRFLEEHGNTFSKLEVLLFLGRHPHTRFSLDALVGGGEANRPQLVDGVRSLVEEGIVSEEKGEHGSSWYFLTRDEQNRRLVEWLGMLDCTAVRRRWRDCCVRGRT